MIFISLPYHPYELTGVQTSAGSSVEKVEGLMRGRLEPGEGREAVFEVSDQQQPDFLGAVSSVSESSLGFDSFTPGD